MLVNANLRRNFIHREKFFVAFDEYSMNCAEHRLIKSTLTKILRTTVDEKNFRLTTRLLADSGKSEAVALLFPMEKLFESYVAEHVKKNFSDRFSVRTQVRENFLFDEPKSFALMPDILLEGQEKIIFDTKWKLKVSEADMYQMFAYSRRYAAQKIFLLCPPNDDGEKFFRSTVDNFNVRIFFVDLFDINASIQKLFRD